MGGGVEDGHSYRTLHPIRILYICCYLLATAPIPTRECEGAAPLYRSNLHTRCIQDDPRTIFHSQQRNVTALFERRGTPKFV